MCLTVRQLIQDAQALLAAVSSTPRLDAELLLAHVLGWSRARLLAERDFQPDDAAGAAFAALVERRRAREPVAYLIGRREFYGLEFAVDQRVLVPRPETELLVELALTWARRQPLTTLRIADVGVGSGAIAVALAVHLPDARIYAVDISPAALAVAAANVERHAVSKQVTLLTGDLLTALPAPLDLIVSNPPYTRLHAVDPGVAAHEPHLALDGGADGLVIYRRLLRQAPHWLQAGGLLLLEIGAWQRADVTVLAQAAFPRAQITVHRDLAGRDRVVAVQT